MDRKVVDKPEQAIEKIVAGRLEKFYSQILFWRICPAATTLNLRSS